MGETLPQDPKLIDLSEHDKMMSDQDDQSEQDSNEVMTSSISEEGKNYEDYFCNYFPNSSPVRENMKNMFLLNRRGASLYQLPAEDGIEKKFHIIWVYNNPDNIIALHRPILENDKQSFVLGHPELIGSTNEILVESFNQAISFYDWHATVKGFIVEGRVGFGLEGGNVDGIRINIEEIRPLIEAIQKNDIEEIETQQKHLTASVVHELTHNERDDGLTSTPSTEIASHIAQFCFDPNDNEVFNRQLLYSFAQIKNHADKRESHEPLNLYDKAVYFALLITADRLAEHSQETRTALESDPDPYKIATLMRLGDLISDSEQKYLKENILREIMITSNNQLLQTAREIQQKNGVPRQAIEM